MLGIFTGSVLQISTSSEKVLTPPETNKNCFKTRGTCISDWNEIRFCVVSWKKISISTKSIKLRASNNYRCPSHIDHDKIIFHLFNSFGYCKIFVAFFFYVFSSSVSHKEQCKKSHTTNSSLKFE